MPLDHRLQPAHLPAVALIIRNTRIVNVNRHAFHGDIRATTRLPHRQNQRWRQRVNRAIEYGKRLAKDARQLAGNDAASTDDSIIESETTSREGLTDSPPKGSNPVMSTVFILSPYKNIRKYIRNTLTNSSSMPVGTCALITAFCPVVPAAQQGQC